MTYSLYLLSLWELGSSQLLATSKGHRWSQTLSFGLHWLAATVGTAAAIVSACRRTSLACLCSSEASTRGSRLVLRFHSNCCRPWVVSHYSYARCSVDLESTLCAWYCSQRLAQIGLECRGRFGVFAFSTSVRSSQCLKGLWLEWRRCFQEVGWSSVAVCPSQSAIRRCYGSSFDCSSSRR